MAHWLVIPKNHDGALKPDLMQVVEAASDEEAAAYVYMNAVVFGPVSVFSSDASHRGDDGPTARLPGEGQPQ